MWLKIVSSESQPLPKIVNWNHSIIAFLVDLYHIKTNKQKRGKPENPNGSYKCVNIEICSNVDVTKLLNDHLIGYFNHNCKTNGNPN